MSYCVTCFNVLYCTVINLICTAGNFSHLSLLIKKLVDNDFGLVKEDGVEEWGHLMTDQLLDVFLNLGPKLLVVAHQ